jgi:hypothetical protein
MAEGAFGPPGCVFLDRRNSFDPAAVRAAGFVYKGIGRSGADTSKRKSVYVQRRRDGREGDGPDL